MYGAGCLHFLICMPVERDLIPIGLEKIVISLVAKSPNRKESSSIFLTDRPVSSTTADRFLNQLSLPEEAKQQDRIRVSSTETEAFPSQILFQNLTTFNLVETQINIKAIVYYDKLKQ